MFAGLSVCEGLDSGNSMFLIDYAASMEIISTAASVELFTVDTKSQSNDYVVGIVEGSSTYYSCTPTSPSPCRLVLILIATRYEMIAIL